MNISKPNISRSEKASHPHHRSSAILDWCDSGFHWEHSSSLELVSYTWLEENKNGYILCNPIYFPFVTISSYWSICRGRICEMTSSLNWKSLFRILTFLRKDYADHINSENTVAVLGKFQQWCLSLVSLDVSGLKKHQTLSPMWHNEERSWAVFWMSVGNSPLTGDFIRLIVFEL